MKTGSDESHFATAIPLTSCFIHYEEQSHKTVCTAFEARGEPKRTRTEVLLVTSRYLVPLGQIGSRVTSECCMYLVTV